MFLIHLLSIIFIHLRQKYSVIDLFNNDLINVLGKAEKHKKHSSHQL